jgi:probable F420-dependent oxidoreductase
VMGAIAATTERVKMGPGVLISPYRHPLSDARQFATIDNLSNGRVILGVGAGWMLEEFQALGHSEDFHARRRAVLDECIQIYDQVWREGVVTFHGEFFDFENMGVFPQPVQKPRPPIIVAATTKGTARLIGRRGDGFMPILTRTDSRPEEHAELQDEIRREAERVGRDPSEIVMTGFTSFRLSHKDDEEATREPRWNLGGTPEQILEDLEGYAAQGYCMMNMAPICPSRTYAEFAEQAEWLAKEVLPEAKKIEPQGEWKMTL